MRRKHRDKALRWLTQAEHDLEDAKFNASGERYNVTCFLCQGGGESAQGLPYLRRRGSVGARRCRAGRKGRGKPAGPCGFEEGHRGARQILHTDAVPERAIRRHPPSGILG